MKISKKRRILISSFITMLFSLVLFTATTFAWFSDSANSANNIIQVGNLDAEMYWSNDISSDTWYDIEDQSNNTVFSEDNYEPGYTSVRYLKIVNAGALAFKYDLSLLPLGQVGELAEVVDVYYLYDTTSNISSDSLTEMSNLGTIKDVLGTSISDTQVLLPKNVHDGTHKASEVIIAVALKMQTSAGNDYQGKSIGDGFSIRLVATQYSFEEDSFGKDFDDAATWPNDVIITDTLTSVPVESTSDNKVSTEVNIENKSGNVNATVPTGVLLEEGTSYLTLKVTEVEDSKANVKLDEDEVMLSLDVHIDGVSKDNEVVMGITMDALLPKGLNLGNYRLYHVEEAGTYEMTLLKGDATPSHNTFSYDPITGDVTLYLKSFSEVSFIADTEVKWEGNVDTKWYNTEAAEFVIANGDQLAGFAQIVGGMAKGIERDSFEGKKVTLVCDINLADDENNNVSDKIFYPIGYYYNNDSTAPYSKVYSFEGVFDGNGHTIKNFYQNTWEIKGDYDGNYYKDGMGLFGYVVNGEVANLRVENFSSDGEFTPTGVIAAFAVNSKFINISISNCNPRVYNTGNGGIVGIAGDSSDTTNTNTDTDAKLLLKNITVDNSNKISALWGSWDVACGGLMGMFRGNGEVEMINCHVAAQIDVYNDVCGNYQYYWYRYAGMIIGSIRGKNITNEDGYTVPDTTGITATDCTIHFGDWNSYYYCELVANSIASYTHDHQFSRLTQVDSVDVNNMTYTIDGVTKAIPTSGRVNYVVVDGAHSTSNATCYHFVDGKEWKHEDAGTEVINGKEVLKEDNHHIYLPFKQIIQGDGWGVKHLPVYDDGKTDFSGITVLDRIYDAQSYDKFESNSDKYYYAPGETIKVGDLFRAVLVPTTGMYPINSESVLVTVSPVGDSSKVYGVHTNNPENWTNGTLTLYGSGKAIITISDYTFCNPTTIEVEVSMLDKFDVNTIESRPAGSTIKVGDLFTADEEFGKYIAGNVIIEITHSDNSKETITVEAGNDWTTKEISLKGEGTTVVTIVDSTTYCKAATNTVNVIKVNKLTPVTLTNSVDTGSVVTLGSLFDTNSYSSYLSNEIKVEVINPDGTNSSFTVSKEEWATKTITLTGVGEAIVKVSDCQYCDVITNTIQLHAVKKFDEIAVGNLPVGTTKLASDLFKLNEKYGHLVSGEITITVSYNGVVNETYTATKDTLSSTVIEFTQVGETTITITDGETCIPTTNTVNSEKLVKFVALEQQTMPAGSTVTLGSLFNVVSENEKYITDNIIVEVVTPDGKTEKIENLTKANWKDTKITLNGVGTATITIVDCDYCEEVTNTVELIASEKFEVITTTTEFIAGEYVRLGDLFNAKVEVGSNITVNVNFEDSDYEDLKLTIATNWEDTIILLNGLGSATISINDGEQDCLTTELKVQLVKGVKFEAVGQQAMDAGSTVTLGELFTSTSANLVDVKYSIEFDDNEFTDELSKSVSSDWNKHAITLNGVGNVKVSIYDKFSNETELTITLNRTEKFGIVLPNTDKYLYRVGNGNPVSLGLLFKMLEEGKEAYKGAVSLEIEALNGASVSGVYTSKSPWTSGTIKFSGTGAVKVSIHDKLSTTTELFLEVINADNATSVTNATDKNIVLLDNVSGSSLTISNGYTFYGNGFKVKFNGDGSYRSAALSYGFVSIDKGGVLDNTQIICEVFPKSYMYTSEMTAGSDGRYPYGYSAVVITDNSKISNSYIYGARNNIYVGDGNVVIQNTVTECGSLSNIQIKTNEAYKITLEDVTTIQYSTKSSFDSSVDVLGFGVVVGDSESSSNPTIVLKGEFKQYNWVNSNSLTSNSYAKTAIKEALKATKYQHSINGVTTVNMGIVVLNDMKFTVDETERTNDDIKYELSEISMTGYTGQVYSISKESAISLESGFDYKTDKVIPYVPSTHCTILPQVSFEAETSAVILTSGYNTSAGRNEINISVDLDNISGGSYSLDFSNIKFNSANEYEIYDADNKKVSNSTITLNAIATLNYTINYTEYIYNSNGEKVNVGTASIPLIIKATKTTIEPPKFSNAGTATAIRLVDKAGGDWRPAYTVLTGVTVEYWSQSERKVKTIDLTTIYNNGTISGSVWTYKCDDFELTITGGQVHSDGSKITPVVSNNTLYFASTNKAFTTGTTSRDIILTYVFTDKNSSTTWNRTEKAQYSNLSEYDYSKFKNGTLEAPSSGGGSGCVTPDTLISLSDGSQVRVDALTGNEELLVWNLETGKLDKAPIMFVDSEVLADYEVVKLYFSDGSNVNVIYEHGFWDYDLNRYVYLDSNASEYIGHWFAKQNGDSLEKVQLADVQIVTETTTAWSPVTVGHLCYFVNGVLSMPGGVGGLFNIFDVDAETMTYDFEAMARDIETYGLFTYEELNAIAPLSEDMFNNCGGAYLKISIAKGNMTLEDLIYMINRYSIYFE